MSHELDVKGRPNHKRCPGCKAVLGRTRVQCSCGHQFIGKAKLVQMRRNAGEDVRQGKNKPKRVFELSAAVAADAERQLMAIAACKPVKHPIAEPHTEMVDVPFECRALSGGCMLLYWPSWDLKVTLTAKQFLLEKGIDDTVMPVDGDGRTWSGLLGSALAKAGCSKGPPSLVRFEASAIKRQVSTWRRSDAYAHIESIRQWLKSH